jgi:hypothetical protein
MRTALLFVLLATSVAAQESPQPESPPQEFRRKIRWGGEIKAGFRNSADAESVDTFPFPPSFLAPGQTTVFERTVAAGSSLEVQDFELVGEADFAPHVSARAVVHFLDLYNRNPTSSDDRIALREAWVRLGKKPALLEPAAGTSFYMLIGKAPRFSKQILRRLESYGLWGTAVGRFEEAEVELGGSIGKNVYWRAQVANGNPLFFRDPNALAGDNGTPERAPQPGPRPISGTVPIYQSGFPILYDTKASDVNLNGQIQLGGGLGYRWKAAGGKKAVDALAWYFHRDLEEAPAIRGTFYLGDLTLLKGVLIPLPYEGRDKREAGVNIEARHGGARFFGQYVNQDIAHLGRKGVEVELAYVFPLNGLFASGDSPIGNWIQPALRFSSLNTDFVTPKDYPAPSVGWDWRKWDIGLRFGILKGVDVTAEYSRLDAMTDTGTIHPDEALVTFRAEF